MAFDVVIAGGGFGGQLGHPPSLETYLDEARHTYEAPGQ